MPSYIQTRVQTIFRHLWRRKVFVACISTAVAITVGLSIGISIQQAADSTAKKQVVLAELKKDQQAKSKELAKQQEDAHDIGADVSTLTFKDVSDKTYAKKTCSRLQDRSGIVFTGSGCDYRLRAHGALNMAVVFVYGYGYNPGTDSLGNPDDNDRNSLSYVNAYLKSQAARYKVTDPPQIKIQTFGPYGLTSPVNQFEYRNDGYQILNVFNQTSKANNVPEDQYDMVHFVLLNSVYGGAAFPGIHRAFTFNSGWTIPTFVHETLHLFGATDKYNNSDCSTIGTNDPFNRYNGTLPGSDIMCSNFSLDQSSINDITAREIGWAN